MTARTLRVCIDRLVLRNVDDSGIGDLPGLVSERLRGHSEPDIDEERPIPRSGRKMTEAAAKRVAAEVGKRINPR